RLVFDSSAPILSPSTIHTTLPHPDQHSFPTRRSSDLVATSQEAVQNQNEPQLRDENAHNDKSVHGVLNPTYQAGLSTPWTDLSLDRKSGSAGMPRPTSYAVFCSKKREARRREPAAAAQ